jgi:hypothetical protein
MSIERRIAALEYLAEEAKADAPSESSFRLNLEKLTEDELRQLRAIGLKLGPDKNLGKLGTDELATLRALAAKARDPLGVEANIEICGREFDKRVAEAMPEQREEMAKLAPEYDRATDALREIHARESDCPTHD